jgi:hypothetical protein
MKLQLFINGKLVTEQLFTKEVKARAVKILVDRYWHATRTKEWAVYEIKESKMNEPGFRVREDETIIEYLKAS